jgi:hypothetical protein
MKRAPYLVLMTLAVALFLGGCSPGIYITRYRPSRVNLGATRKVAVLNVVGPPESMGVVMTELSQQMVRGAYFQVFDAMPQRMSFVILPGAVLVQNIDTVRTAVPADVYLTAAVTDWTYRERQQVEEKVENGTKVKHLYRTPEGRVAIQFQVVRAADGRIVTSQEYHGSFDGSRYEPPGQSPPLQSGIVREACERAVDSFLDDITPATVTDKIVLDDEDEDLKPGVQLCKNGALDAAMAAFEDLLKKKPGSAGATYNLGVLYEAKGEYQKAEELYRKAYSMRPKSLYNDALQEMHERMNDEQRLKQRI